MSAGAAAPLDDSSARIAQEFPAAQFKAGSERMSPKTAKPSELITSVQSATSSRRVKSQPVAASSNRLGKPNTAATPKKQRRKPVTIVGYYWVANGKGWALRGSTRNERGNNPYYGYLTAEDYRQMKADHKGEALKGVLQHWIETAVRAKGGS